MFYPYSIKINICKGSCNTINGPYAQICVPDQIKNINVKVVNLLSRTNETTHIKWHKTCKCKCKLDASLDIISLSDYKISDSCVVYIILFFCVFNNKYVYGYLCLFISLFKK